jgi:copper homeostasis protein (lipoprotein)
MRLRGMYLYMADAASFTECLTGRRWPVPIEGGHLALERAYLAERAHPGDLLLVAVQAGFVQREPEPGAATRELLRVESLEQAWPGETCAAEAPAPATLRNTRWRIVEIDGEPVRASEGGQRAPYVQFAASGDRVRGQASCNALSGHFVEDGARLRFERLALTRTPCPGPAAAQERRLLAALQATAGLRIEGGALQLRAADGRVRVRAEALYLR